MKQTAKWWHAQFNLGWRSFLHYLRKLWPWHQKAGLEQFKKNYVSEKLLPYSATLRKIAHEPGRCVTCGLCDAACPILNKKEATSFLGPMRLVVGAMRGGPLSLYAAQEFNSFSGKDCLHCRKCEDACPQEIPIVQLAQEFTKQWQQ